MMNCTVGRTLFSCMTMILLLSACAGPVPAATQESGLVEQVIEQSVALTVAAKEAQEQSQKVMELSNALTVAAQTPTLTLEPAGPTPEAADSTPVAPTLEPTSIGTPDPNAPTVREISPNTGFTTGGDIVTIKGTNFVSGEGKTRFFFGDSEAQNVECLSTTQCTAVVPTGTRGNVVVRAELAENIPGGNSSPGTFNYIFLDPDAPVIERIEPREGSIRGGTSVTITGRNFIGGKRSEDPKVTNFYFGKTEAKDVVCLSKTQCKVKSPAGIEGYVIIRAENAITPNGPLESQHIEGNDYDGFKYNGPTKYGCSVLTTAPRESAIFSGGDTFVIKWVVSNTGTRTWPAGIDVKYAAGVQLSGSTIVEIPVALKPNDSYALPSIGAVAPDNPGTYYMSWIVEGMGCSAYVSIDVE